MVSYTKLWNLLAERGMKRTDLKQVISTVTLAKLGKNENVTVEMIEKICIFLKCQPSDIMTVYTQEDLDKAQQTFLDMSVQMIKVIKENGGNVDEFFQQASEQWPKFIDEMRERVKNSEE